MKLWLIGGSGFHAGAFVRSFVFGGVGGVTDPDPPTHVAGWFLVKFKGTSTVVPCSTPYGREL